MKEERFAERKWLRLILTHTHTFLQGENSGDINKRYVTVYIPINVQQQIFTHDNNVIYTRRITVLTARTGFYLGIFVQDS
jgi:hypothetical protein